MPAPRHLAPHAAVLPTLALAASLVFPVAPADARLRVVSYNTAGNPATDPTYSTIFSAINTEVRAGVARPVDVLLLQEQDTLAGDTQNIVDILNGTVPGSPYARNLIQADTNGAGRVTAVYNTDTVDLTQEITVGSVSTSGATRQPMRYRFRPVGYTDGGADFYVYNSHYNSSSESRRLVEATTIRNNADALGEGAHIIYAGDFNIDRSSDDMFVELLSPGAGQAQDPINAAGTWTNSSVFRYTHTQSPVTSAKFSGQITGGMDDRFDFQVTTAEFLDNEGLSYINGTYRPFGNNNTHSLNGPISSGTGASPAVLSALEQASDHLPLVADYQLPAWMSANLGSPQSPVLVGASATVPLSVENIAPAQTSLDADELDYMVQFQGAAFTDSALAAAGANLHDVPLNTAFAGARTGTMRVSSQSQGVQNNEDLFPISYTVLDHATPSFDSTQEVVTFDIDFGTVIRDSVVADESVSLFNLGGTAGFTADLDLDSIEGTGDTGTLLLNANPFQGLEEGLSQQFGVSFDTSTQGLYEATYTFSLSDEDLPGELTGLLLTLNVAGEVLIPTPATATLLLALAGGVSSRCRRNGRSQKSNDTPAFQKDRGCVRFDPRRPVPSARR